ncbi:hypothetical protein [Streptomyces hiroshimensis]|nr:hypothetical protein [Streptomyces hiroshimensis]
MAGLTAAPEVLPGVPFARGLQEIAGAGFLLYCTTAFVIIAAKLWFAARSTLEPRSTLERSAGDRP